jgi:hypothetical protein
VINRIGESVSFAAAMFGHEGAAGISVPKKRLVACWHYLQTEVADHPTRCLAAAMSIGVLIGWIIKRH